MLKLPTDEFDLFRRQFCGAKGRLLLVIKTAYFTSAQVLLYTTRNMHSPIRKLFI